VTLSSQRDDSARQKVHIAVYYEALCPDSRSFIVKQLGPTYHKLPGNMDIELVPYGKATVRKFALTYEIQFCIAAIILYYNSIS